MSGKTNYSSWIPWLSVLCMIIIIFIIVAYFSTNIFYSPIVQAQGISDVQSINKFSTGAVGTDPFWYQRLSMLGWIILVFIAGPVLWFAGSKTGRNAPYLGWHAGVFLILMGFITAGMGLSYYSFEAGQNWDRIVQNRNKDQVRSELITLSNRAMELYWLPKSKGGTGQNLSQVTLSDLKDDPFISSFKLKKSSSDSMLILFGIGTVNGEAIDFENANGEKGKVQLAIQVNASALEYNWVRADSLTN